MSQLNHHHDEEHANRRMPRDQDCDFSKWVPMHHEPGSSLMCDGCHWYPVPEPEQGS